MTGDLQESLQILFSPGQVVELRGISEEGTASGYFDDPGRLASQAEALDVLPEIQGIYVTLNEVNPALLSRRANRVKFRLGRKDTTTADADIIRRRWFPVDIDPVRPSGVSSTDEEHQAARDAASRVAAYLTDRGWPSPLVAGSGNGAHLLYRIDLPNDERSRELVRRCLEVLSSLFSDDRVTVDTANHNAARIWKLYGTMSRKGDNTSARPHRRSRLVAVPDRIECVPEDLLAGLAASLPVSPDRQPRKEDRAIDLGSWLEEHGIGVRSEKPYQGGTLYLLDACPFSDSHRDGAFAIQFGNGAVHAGCHHASCGGGKQRWKELRERYEQDNSAGRKEGMRKTGQSEGLVKNGDTPAPYRALALDILAHGDPIATMLSALARDHVGDETLARCLIYSMATQAVVNTDGLHVSVTGESGKGKTHAYKKMIRQVPDRYKLKGTVSDKALYYMNDLAPRSVLMSDDTALSDSIQEILKAATSNFREPITHRTVTKDRTVRECTIPERCVWWIAKKEGTGDDQVMNRMMTCWIDESAEQDRRVLLAKQKREKLEPGKLPDETPELLTARAIWEIMQEQLIWVVIPFSERIRFSSVANRRNPDMLYDLIKSHAVLFFMQRKQGTAEDGTPFIYATGEDFAAANEVFMAISGISGSQELKLTRKESDLIDVIQRSGRAEFTIQELQDLTGWPYSTMYRTLKGYDTRGKNHTGLLEKCPAISFTDRTVTTPDENGNLVRRRTDAYTWNREVFEGWASGGGCWLDRDPDDDEGSFPSFQQLSSSFPAPAGNQDEASSASGSSSIPENKNNSVQEYGVFQQKGGTGTHGTTGPLPSSCTQDAGNAANEDQSPQISLETTDKAPERAPIVSSTGTETAGNVEREGPACGPGIYARDYKPLDIPEHTPCFLCGGAWSHHVEKLTAERKARPKEEQAARRICKSCYAAAKRKAQQEAIVLPGTFNITQVERLKASIGSCSICGLETAVYLDRSSGVKLCEFCFRRAVQAPDHGEVAG